MTKVPSREMCANECGRRAIPGMTLCRSCFKRASASFAVPGRDVAHLPPPSLSVAPRARKGPIREAGDQEIPFGLVPDEEDELRRSMLRHAAKGTKLPPGYTPKNESEAPFGDLP